MMPCNYSGWFDPKVAADYGIVDFDWSNAKQLWANAKPMDCEERLLTQAQAVKAVKPTAKVFVYRNIVKALPWFSSVREKLLDPAYSGWFLKFHNYSTPVPQNRYAVPPCTGNKCSGLYHDQDQTPQHPKGDGSCTDECDCGEGLPCGEYLFDHRNESLRQWLAEEFIGGKQGIANPHIDGEPHGMLHSRFRLTCCCNNHASYRLLSGRPMERQAGESHAMDAQRWVLLHL